MIKVLAYRIPNLFIGIICADVIHTAEHLHHILGGIQDGRDDKDTEKEIDQESPLVKYPNQILPLPLQADLISQSYIETADEEVSEDEGEDGGHAHSHCDESAIPATPPEVDDDDCATEYLADGGGQDGTQQVLLLLLWHIYNQE